MASSQAESSFSASRRPETIQVQLNEGLLSKERRFLHDVLANARSKLSSMQMFNPVKNQSMREQQETWDEKEKYTLDSLNEARGPLDDKFQWNRSEDGREVWASKMQYFLAITRCVAQGQAFIAKSNCRLTLSIIYSLITAQSILLSYSIGLGNVIRFPILVQKNGGLAFVVLFVIMLILEGIPLFYLELAVGQRMRKASISCWNLVSPFAAGIGIASALVSFVVGLYYNAMVAWTLLYLWDSGKSALRKNEFSFAICPGAPGSTSPPSARLNNSTAQCQAAGSFQYFWFQETLEASDDVNSGWSNPNWPVLVCLSIAWLISYICLAKGLSSSKRVVYVASTFPYVILSVFFLKALSLPGMADGVYYLFKPQWTKLLDPFVWLQAAAQVFFSLGLGFGGLIALSSYNPVNNNCYKDAVKVSVINFSTSIYAGVVIFAILGYKANLSNDRCLAERDRAIYFYLSDYNMKVLDFGSAFDPSGGQKEHKSDTNNLSTGSDFSMGILGDANEQLTKDTASNSSDIAKASTPADSDYYDSGDALAAVRTLDRQLDKSISSNEFDYGDSDVEFTINMSKLISKDELDKVIQQIPGLPSCSIQKELDGASQGTGLVFVVMTEAISHFRDAPVWTIIFFLMLFTLGLDSQFGNLEGLLSSVADLPLANAIRRQWFTGFICCLSLIISAFFFAHSAGTYMFAIFDEYAGSFSLVLIALFELVTISYIYGLKRFCDDCELMTGKRPPFIILLSWRYISPILLLVVIFATIREFTLTLDYEAWTGEQLVVKVWPRWCITLGACLILACVLWIPAIALLRILKIKLLPEENINQCWFPADELREFHDLQEEHKVTKLERILFGFQEED